MFQPLIDLVTRIIIKYVNVSVHLCAYVHATCSMCVCIYACRIVLDAVNVHVHVHICMVFVCV